MSYLKIITNSSLLKNKCEEIENPHLPEYKELAEEMLLCMHEANGIGLAAPQIGKDINLIVIKGDLDGAPNPDHILLANPIITKKSSIKTSKMEGCLSLPGKTVKKKRSLSIEVEGYHVGLGMKVKLECTGLCARVVQHEVDHLNGITLD